MKGIKFTAFVIALALLWTTGCQKKKASTKMTEEVKEKVAQKGEKMAGTLLSSLQKRLLKAIEKGGLAHAVSFCSKEALPLTEEVEKKLASGVRIKRTSHKIRNPANGPDKWEKEALDHFQNRLRDSGQLPSHIVQKTTGEGEVRFRYYKPLRIKGLCLKCHGGEKDIPPPVQKALDKNYPQDQARGYQSGDFRGVIRISFPSKVLTEKGE